MKEFFKRLWSAIKESIEREDGQDNKSCANCGAYRTPWCKNNCSCTDMSEWIPKND